MSGFAADWLSLREPADLAARSEALIAHAADLIAQRPSPVVCDLGSGTGASVRAFASAFPKDTHWHLVDDDAATLAMAAREAGPVTTADVDLSVDVAPWPADCALVTATALFDLAAPAWIDALADRLAADRLPLLACLTYDGRIALTPDHADDAEMIAAFDAHQALDKGLGGPAAGPGAVAALKRAMSGQGYDVRVADTPWQLEALRDQALIQATLSGWAGAVAEAGIVDTALADRWLAARRERTDRLMIGHKDLLAIPR